MNTTTRWSATLLVVIAGFLAQPGAGWAQGDGTRIHSSAEHGLVVDKTWEMVLPEIVEEDDGRMWIRYRLPNGGYESFPFQVGDPLTVKWTRSGTSRIEDYPAGWSVEDTEAIVDWHMNGGRGSFIVDGGDWKETDPRSTLPAPATTSSTATSSAADDDCSGPYCDRPISGIQSVSTANDPDRPAPPIPDEPTANRMHELKQAWDALQKKCDDLNNPNRHNDCQAAYAAKQEYIDASVKGGN